MAYTKDVEYNPQQMKEIMWQAKYILRRNREWFDRESHAAPMHAFVVKAIEMARPNDWQNLLMQWPHMSDTNPNDNTKVAYTRDEKSGIANKQVVTSLGKYLRGHFSQLPDDAIRDIVALAQSQQANFKFVRTTAEMIYHLHKGPGSCMQWEDRDGVEGEDGEKHHPYETYCPSLGWHMAVRLQGDDTVGRALCMDDGNNKFYVRTYKKTDGYSHADEQLEAWLKEQGYAKVHGWEGCKLKLIPARCNDCGFVAPYLDGDAQGVERNGRTLMICDGGDYTCTNTNGDADERGDPCSDCGERMSDDDGYWVGPWEDARVCEGCCDYNYTYVRGRNRRGYYIHNDYAVYVESQEESYDEEYLDTNDIVELANGSYEHIDNAIEVSGDYYHVDDERIVRCVDDDEYHLRDDAHYHEDSGEWYADEGNMPKDEDDESDADADAE